MYPATFMDTLIFQILGCRREASGNFLFFRSLSKPKRKKQKTSG
jgi:hypothetical protein